MKKLLLILLLPWVVMGASSDSLYWTNAAADNDMNNPANYTEGDAGSAAAEIAATDTLFFADGSAAATASGNISVANVVTTAGYSGAWSINGYTLTTSNDGPSFDHTGTLHLGNGVTCNGASGTFHVGSGVGAVTATSCVLTMNGTTGMVLHVDKLIGSYAAVGFSKLILGANAIVTSSGTTSYTSYTFGTTDGTPSLVLNNGSTYTINSPNVAFHARSDQTIASFGVGTTLNGTGSISFSNFSNIFVTVTIPAFTYTGTGSIIINFAGFSNNINSKFLIAGNINVGTAELYIYDSWNYALPSISFEAGLSIICGKFYCGGANTSFNDANFTVSSFIVHIDSRNLLFQTSQWTCSGSWTFGSNHTVNPGTSLVTLNGTGAQTITNNGKSFYDLTVNNTGTAFVILVDSLTCNDLTLTDGPCNFNGIGISAVDYTYTTTDSVRDGRLWLSGNYTRGALADKCDTAGQHIRFSAGASHTMAAANKTYAAVTTSGPLTISGGATIAALSYGIDGIPVTVADGTTLTVGTASIGGTPEAPDTLQGAGAGATYTGPQDTLSNTLVALLTCTNPLYLDSSANTSGTNSNVKSLSYTGATLSSATGLPGDTIGISTGNGLVGGAASIGDSAVTLTVVNSDSGYIVVPLAMPAGSYDVGLSNSDGDTLTLAGGLGVTSSGSTRRSGRGWLGLGVWIRP